MLPLFHDFAGETVLVFGGGRVGCRKARFFAQEATVIVVSAEFTRELCAESVSQIKARVSPDDLSDWFDRAAPALVVAATDDGALNEAIETTAIKRGILVNRADKHGNREIGSVVVPATVRDGDVIAAVGTGGRSPALSKYLRQQIEPIFGGADEMAELTAEIRETLQERDVPAKNRREAVRAVINSEAVWEAIENRNNRESGGDSVGIAARNEATRVVSDVLNPD
ncbi:precorrin-2 dehydrogenase / sirohydrochlorin ferrochelatase [Haladaptatus litoreus]|uniref:precorrin-2 dehydrogenase n=1 Tax=Haladaptatus litoreus TaxID=553468 RepID=A0A1N6XDK1_9EURY|nr:bifunctional precorrin-2 dehydrogenase/sirohydrochlorin ferrochelatase [Haladaptatus litoreus]SIR00393.1 precorrin-2 dehydrogenase / sirohydrochlorin ferrochelatase [Haladaptatus litoreus]